MPSRSEKQKRRAAAPGPAEPASAPKRRAATAPADPVPAPRRRSFLPQPPYRSFSARAMGAAIALLAVFATQAWIASQRDSVTIDEYLHLAVGLNALHTGDLSQDPVDSHVVRMLAAAPLLVDPPVFEPPPGTVTWQLGQVLMASNAERYHDLFLRTRPVIIALALLAAIVMTRWAYVLYGPMPALASLAMFAFSPSLLAHGHLITLDMAVTFGFLLALFSNWKFLEAPSLRDAAWVGVAIGFANLLKISGVVLVAMIVFTWAIRAYTERRDRIPATRWAAMLATAGIATIVTINVGYGFEGTFGLLRDCILAPGGKLASLADAMPWLRLPLPKSFLDGIDVALEAGKGHEPSYFLLGELSADGWWYYHLVAFAAKCPLPVLGAGLFAMGAWMAGRSPGKREYAIFVPILLLFAANSAFNSLPIGERHVLAVYPLLFIGISPWLAASLRSLRAALEEPGAAAAFAASDWKARARTWLPGGVAALGLAWLVAGTIAVGPRYLQYFNEWAGGPEGGHRVLIDSNIDWGQDLIRLREYMDANAIDSVALAYFGRVHPGVYGIKFTPLQRGVSRGKAVVSASFLMGRPYFWYLDGRMRWVKSRTYEWLRGYKPVARVGSMFVFDLP